MGDEPPEANPSTGWRETASAMHTEPGILACISHPHGNRELLPVEEPRNSPQSELSPGWSKHAEEGRLP